MTRKVVCFDADPARRGLLLAAAREAGADAVEAGVAAVPRLSRGAHAVVAAGEEGIELLVRLALDRPSLPRIAVLDGTPSPAELLALVERVHPWAVVTDANDVAHLRNALADALAAAETPQGGADATQRVVRPSPPPSFERLVSDPLTGTNGYHYLRLRLDEELERATRYNRPLSLVFIDLDDLRGINDRWGRPVGDFALKHVAGTLSAGARAVDRVGRWAGGTFALLLPETNANAAFGLAERLRGEIANRRFHEPGPPGADWQKVPPRLRLTVSCGVASTVRGGAFRPQSLIARTDAALARAKQKGPNRSVVDG